MAEPEENVLESGASSLVSLGKYDLLLHPTLLVLPVQDLAGVREELRHLAPQLGLWLSMVRVRPRAVELGEIVSEYEEEDSEEAPDVEEGLESLAHNLMTERVLLFAIVWCHRKCLLVLHTTLSSHPCSRTHHTHHTPAERTLSPGSSTEHSQ